MVLEPGVRDEAVGGGTEPTPVMVACLVTDGSDIGRSRTPSRAGRDGPDDRRTSRAPPTIAPYAVCGRRSPRADRASLRPRASRPRPPALRVDPLLRASSGRRRPGLDERRRAGGGEGARAGLPPHRRDTWRSSSARSSAGSVDERAASRSPRPGTRGARERHGVERRVDLGARPAPSTGVERAGDLQPDGADLPLLRERLERSIAATDPLITTCTGEFSFATSRTSSPRASSQSDSAASAPTPSSAAIVPGAFLARALHRAAAQRRRSRARRRASSTSAATRARELAERVAGRAQPRPAPSASSTRKAATSQASSAGWTNSVVASAASSWQPATTSRPMRLGCLVEHRASRRMRRSTGRPSRSTATPGPGTPPRRSPSPYLPQTVPPTGPWERYRWSRRCSVPQQVARRDSCWMACRAHGREGSTIFFPHVPASRDGGGARVPWSRHGCRPRDREHARLRSRARRRAERALRGRDQHPYRRHPRGRRRGQADDRPHAEPHPGRPPAEGRRDRRLRRDREDAPLLHPAGAQAAPAREAARGRLRAVRDHRGGAARGRGGDDRGGRPAAPTSSRSRWPPRSAPGSRSTSPPAT